MKFIPFPGCCTARTLVGLGETGTAEWEYRPAGNRLAEGELTKYMTKQIAFFKRAGDVAIVFATTNSEQKTANKELAAFGWVRTPSVKKRQHAKQELIGWYYIVGEPVEEKVEAPPIVKEEKLVEGVEQPDIQIGDRVYIKKRAMPFNQREEDAVGFKLQMAFHLGAFGTVKYVGQLGDVPFATVDTGSDTWNWPLRFLSKR